MKKLVILFMAASLVMSACNNNKDKGPGADRNTTKDKDDYRDKSKDEENDKALKDRENENTSEGWTSSDRMQWMKVCGDPLKEKLGETRATNYCECVLGKIQERYSTFEKANTQGTEEEGMKLGKECIKELGYDVQGGN